MAELTNEVFRVVWQWGNPRTGKVTPMLYKVKWYQSQEALDDQIKRRKKYNESPYKIDRFVYDSKVL
jgi:hypothetical protein